MSRQNRSRQTGTIPAFPYTHAEQLAHLYVSEVLKQPRVTKMDSSFVLSTALQRAALTSSLQLRYEQAKRVDGLQSDGWILLKCFRSRVTAGSP